MVPKIIHHIVGKNPSNLVKKCLKSWEQLHDFGYSFKIWDDESLSIFIEKYYIFALPSFLNARNYAEAADIARYLLIFHFGGYYIDWDIHLIDPNAFIDLRKRFKHGYLVVDPTNDTLASEHFSAQTGELYLLRVVDDIVDTYNRGDRDLMQTPQYSGPYRMKYSFIKHPQTQLARIPVKEIFEYNYQEIRDVKVFLQQGIMIHFWEHAWMRT
jgi:mannosyltransferase OCH1-like enzyme